MHDSDLADARSTEFDKRRAVAHDMRQACLTAGFFYGQVYALPDDHLD